MRTKSKAQERRTEKASKLFEEIEVTIKGNWAEDIITIRATHTPEHSYLQEFLDAIQNKINEIREREKTDEEHEAEIRAERREELENEGIPDDEIDGIIDEELGGYDE